MDSTSTVLTAHEIFNVCLYNEYIIVEHFKMPCRLDVFIVMAKFHDVLIGIGGIRWLLITVAIRGRHFLDAQDPKIAEKNGGVL